MQPRPSDDVLALGAIALGAGVTAALSLTLLAAAGDRHAAPRASSPQVMPPPTHSSPPPPPPVLHAPAPVEPPPAPPVDFAPIPDSEGPTGSLTFAVIRDINEEIPGALRLTVIEVGRADAAPIDPELLSAVLGERPEHEPAPTDRPGGA